MAQKNDKEVNTTSDSLNKFLGRNRKSVIIISSVIVVACIAVVAFFVVKEKVTNAGLTEIDNITFNYTKNSSSLSDSELSARRDTALKALDTYLAKNGIVGVRANMLAADITYQKKDFKASCAYWLAASVKGGKSYTVPLCYYNAGSCSEELKDNANAIVYYTKAADTEDFALKTHALFSLGRVQEAQGKYTDAQTVYQKLLDNYPDSEWTLLAKSRILDMQIKGLIK